MKCHFRKREKRSDVKLYKVVRRHIQAVVKFVVNCLLEISCYAVSRGKNKFESRLTFNKVRAAKRDGFYLFWLTVYITADIQMS